MRVLTGWNGDPDTGERANRRARVRVALPHPWARRARHDASADRHV